MRVVRGSRRRRMRMEVMVMTKGMIIGLILILLMMMRMMGLKKLHLKNSNLATLLVPRPPSQTNETTLGPRP
jgi:hypothetical protein